MILYHGSNMAIDTIDLDKCRPYKDFGKGFYLTDIQEQAQRMAARTARMFKGDPTLTAFEFDLKEVMRASGLKVRIFEKPDREWAKFVMSNRDINTVQPCHDYDIVIGLARKSGLDMTDEELMAEANKWELSHGGISGRTAQQFINHCLGMQRSE